MTINLADNNPRVEYSVAQSASQSIFAVPFEFFDDGDLRVYVDGTLKTQGSHYTVSGGDGSTGTVTFSPAVVGATGGSQVVIVRSIPIERTSDFSAGADINRAALNEQLDILTAMVSDNKARIDRSFLLPESDVVNYSLTLPSVSQRANKYLAFGADGSITPVAGTTSNIVVSTFGQTLGDDADAAAALVTLGLTATAAELNVLDGVTASTAELNILDGVTASTAELNILDGVTASTAELNILDGATVTASELNLLSGATALAAPATFSASTSVGTGSSVDLTGIPSSAREVEVYLNGVSLSGSTYLLLQLLVGGSPVTSGYRSASNTSGADAVSIVGFVFFAGGAAVTLDGIVRLVRSASGEWVSSHALARGGILSGCSGGGVVTGVGTVNGIRLLSAGADVFDGGTFTVMWR